MPKPPITTTKLATTGTKPPELKVVSTEVRPPPGRRRVFGAAEKLRIVREYDACERGKRGELLRREGIYTSYVTDWWRELAEHGVEGLSGRRSGRKPKYDKKDLKIQELQKRRGRAERELGVSRKVIALQKKASELLGIALPDPEEP